MGISSHLFLYYYCGCIFIYYYCGCIFEGSASNIINSSMYVGVWCTCPGWGVKQVYITGITQSCPITVACLPGGGGGGGGFGGETKLLIVQDICTSLAQGVEI